MYEDEDFVIDEDDDQMEWIRCRETLDQNEEDPTADKQSFQQRNKDFIQQTQGMRKNDAGILDNIGESLDPAELSDFEAEIIDLGVHLRIISDEERLLFIG